MPALETATNEHAEALRHHFGHERFRPGQEAAVQAAVAGRNVLVVMPTGAGKSLCYQLPALVDPRLTVVVSPLVSLMQDQVDGLDGEAVLINAQRSAGENRAALEAALGGSASLLYVAPERFAAPGFLDRLAGAEIGMLVVDEAHCVSQWGHDFRPDYMRLGEVANRLGASNIFAATATATPNVAADIVRALGLRDPVRITTGFDRPNLGYDVVGIRSAREKRRMTLELLSDPTARPAIVYTGTRKAAEERARWLSEELGLRVPAYHAGMQVEPRAAAQRAFMSGEAQIVVATNAFGMGVDKANVRTVLHDSVPGSLEAYYQEAGRAGRDGAPSRCVLLAEQRDKGLHVFFINKVDDPTEKRRRWQQYRDIWGFVESGGCRRERILRHFGDGSTPSRAGRCCDVCDPVPSPRVEDEEASAPSSALRDGAEPRDLGAPVGPRSLRSAAGSAVRSGRDDSDGADLEGAILTVVASATPKVGRTRAVEILKGGRSKVVLKYGYDELPAYGRFEEWSKDDLMAEVDGLLDSGRLRSTGGRFPKLTIAA